MTRLSELALAGTLDRAVDRGGTEHAMVVGMTPERFDELLSDVMEVNSTYARPALACLDCAETVETASDLLANIDEAIELLKQAQSELAAARRRAVRGETP